MSADWSGENLLALLWAIKWIDELPPIHQQSVGVHSELEAELDRWDEFVSEAELRPEEEIQTMDRYVESVRLREQTPDGFRGIAWLAERFRDFGGGSPTDGDLTIEGVPFRKLDKQARQDVRSIALERHRALRWVLRYELDLDAPAPDLR